MTWFRWFRRKPVVPVIQMHGPLDLAQYQFIRRCLRLAKNKSKVQAMCVQLSSEGGSGVYADTISKLLRDYCDDHDVKLYTFVDKYACSAAMLPLINSDKVFVQPESIIGGCQATASHVQSTENYGISSWSPAGSDHLLQKHFSLIGTNNDSQAQFDDLMNAALKSDTKKLIAEIKEKSRNRIKPDHFQKLESGAYLTGKEVVESGLAEGFGTVQKTLLKEFPDSNLYYIPRVDGAILSRRYLERSLRLASFTAKPKKKKDGPAETASS